MKQECSAPALIFTKAKRAVEIGPEQAAVVLKEGVCEQVLTSGVITPHPGAEFWLVPSESLDLELQLTWNDQDLIAAVSIRCYPKYVASLLKAQPNNKSEFTKNEFVALVTSFFAGFLRCAQIPENGDLLSLTSPDLETLRAAWSNQLIRYGLGCDAIGEFRVNVAADNSLSDSLDDTDPSMGSLDTSNSSTAISNAGWLRWLGVALRLRWSEVACDITSPSNHEIQVANMLQQLGSKKPETWFVISQEEADRRLRTHLHNALSEIQAQVAVLQQEPVSATQLLDLRNLDRDLSHLLQIVGATPPLSGTARRSRPSYAMHESLLAKLECAATATEEIQAETDRLFAASSQPEDWNRHFSAIRRYMAILLANVNGRRNLQ